LNTYGELSDDGLDILSEEECLRLLDSRRLGRVAICLGSIPAVLPVNYAMVGGDVMFFSGPGVKLDAAVRGQSVTFQVDDIDVIQEWGWSVMVTGRMDEAGSAYRARAESLGLYPFAAGARRHLLRIRPDFVSGRRIITQH
jgi:nitroimidazol reductase NimA-like FMN-containing flavoprotein (pyridoxamine 5'-phosphate oxidase superfamily)